MDANTRQIMAQQLQDPLEEISHLRAVNAKLVEALETALGHLITFWRSGLPGSHNTNVSYAMEDVRKAIAEARREQWPA